MDIKVNPRFLGKLFLWLIAVFAAVLVLVLLLTEVDYRQEPVQIVPWSPAEDSPYLCFAAVKGENRLEALDCLDTSLSEVPSNG